MWKRLLFVFSTLVSTAAFAQRAQENAVSTAQDAFGATVGNESIGLYSATSVRGFSPVTAGNVRIEGLYFDRQANLPPRLTPSSTIHVGLSAQGYAFPAPTGIVDYQLNRAGDDALVSIVAGLNPYAAPTVEADAKVPLIADRLSLAAGLSYTHEEYYDGADAPYWRAALTPRWRISDNVEALAFWSLVRGRDEEVAPTIVTAGDYLPPEIPRRNYFGQDWADNELNNTAYGALVKASFDNFAISGGVFRSINERPANYANVFRGTLPDGQTREWMLADPPQRNASTSGELKLTRDWLDGARAHRLHASVRGRERASIYGGTAQADLGARILGQREATPRPEFAFTERTRDDVTQWSGGVAYELRWRNVGEASIGVQHTDYRKRIAQPNRSVVTTKATPWLPTATLAVYATSTIALYAGHAEGLEENGVAPDSAANRNEALPALRTRQTDAGVRWNMTSSMKLIAGLFDVQKPYFATDAANVYRELGEVRHRGVEISLNGKLTTSLTTVLGAVLMQPRVSGDSVDSGRVSDRPVGQTEHVLKLSADYRPHNGALSIDINAAYTDERFASNGGNTVPANTTIDLGARYRFNIGTAPATLRIQAHNITDELTWAVKSNNTFGLTDKRRFSALVYVDL